MLAARALGTSTLVLTALLGTTARGAGGEDAHGRPGRAAVALPTDPAALYGGAGDQATARQVMAFADTAPATTAPRGDDAVPTAAAVVPVSTVAPAREVVAAGARVGPPAAPQPPAPDPSPEIPAARPVRTRVDVPLEIEVHGQVFFDLSARARDDWDRSFELDRARIEVRGRLPRVLTVIEADVSSSDPLKDAFVRFDGPVETRLTAGQFKAPFIERESRSAWSLPLVDRGVVTDELVVRSGLGGRRLGAMGEVRPWGGALEVAAGIFQGTAVQDERPREDYGARIAARPWHALELGASGYRALSAVGPVRQGGAGFAVVRVGALTATVEALAGRLAQGPFSAGIGLLEYTQRLSRQVRLTPVVGLEALRLRGEAASRGSSAVLGAVLGAGSGLKLKLQWERVRRPGETAPASGVAVELATRF